jgi:hypothetical protein
MPRCATHGRKEATKLTLSPCVLNAIREHKGGLSASAYVNDLLWYVLVATDDERERVDNYGVY